MVYSVHCIFVFIQGMIGQNMVWSGLFSARTSMAKKSIVVEPTWYMIYSCVSFGSTKGM